MSDSMHDLIVGVDGGGTGCRAAIGTRAKGILAQAEAGPANFTSDPDRTLANVTKAVNMAAQKAGICQTELAKAYAYLGLAGVMGAADRTRIMDALPFRVTDVSNDQPSAIKGALGRNEGFVLSIGTGIIAARCTEGRIREVSGKGFYVSDQGAGGWLGRATLEQVILCADGMAQHTEVTRRVLAQFGGDPVALATFSVMASPGEYARFARLVIDGLAHGDHWSQEILSTGAQFLTRYLKALDFMPGDTICLMGGLGQYYRSFLAPSLLEGQIKPQGTALEGAFQLALDLDPERSV